MHAGLTHMVYRPVPNGPTSLHEVGTQVDWSIQIAQGGILIELVGEGNILELLPHMSMVIAFQRKDSTWALNPATGSQAKYCIVRVTEAPKPAGIPPSNVIPFRRKP